jgi:hypothetical protein
MLKTNVLDIFFAQTGVPKCTKEAEVFNNYLDAIKLRANKLYNELLATNAEVTSQMLKDAILGTNEARPKTIISVFDDYVERLHSLLCSTSKVNITVNP